MENAPRRIADLDHSALRPQGGYYPSPASWSDQTLYFLLVDRFSDGDERTADNPSGGTSLARDEDRRNAVATEEGAERWREAGKRFVGGTLKGVRSKLGYLKRLGATALWISPVLRQRASDDYSYHGYGTQDFLRIEPRFGTSEDLRDLVAEAHRQGMLVILDIILNHAANVFSYEEGRAWSGEEYRVEGWNDAQGRPTIPFVKADPEDPASWPSPDDAIWPVELQDPAAFTRKGSIGDWDNDPEFLEGDFFDFRDFDHGSGGVDDYRPAPSLVALTEAYKHWIAYADLDGFRIDTVKHMDPGAVRFFSEAIQEFGQTLGKEDFFMVGEITGGRGFALDTMHKTGLDAVLGISGEACLLEGAVMGHVAPKEYFDLFGKSADVPRGTDAWFRNHMVTIIDDHDEVCHGEEKARFASDPGADRLVLASQALNALTLGIPCVYYGSEQAFDGRGTGDDADRYIRESMFGGEFGAFGSRCVHYFDESSPTFKGVADILKVRNEDLAIRRGRQYLRPISGDGETFAFPAPVGDEPMRSIVAWSRVLDEHETLVAISTDPDRPTTAWVTIDGDRHEAGGLLTCVLKTGEATEDAVTIEARDGLAVQITLPPGGVAVYR